MTHPASPLDHRRLVIVTGKGGTGKTTIAAALALGAAARGKRVLVAAVDPDARLAGLLSARPGPLRYQPVLARENVWITHIEPFEALGEYLGLQIGTRRLVDPVLRQRGFRQLLLASPGWRELITLGKVWHLEQMRDGARPRFDLIIVDAPATGHSLTFLDVPRVVVSAVRAGPLRHHTERVEALIEDRKRTLLLPVAIAEELPARETVELVARAKNELGVAIERVVVNAVHEPPYPDDLADLDQRLAALPGRPRARRAALHARARSVRQRTPRARGAESPLRRADRARDGSADRAASLPARRTARPRRRRAARRAALRRARVGRVTLPALERRVVVCVGCGGVGKTTVAAAIALEAARAGRRALVITIDPARRLADALGVETLGNQPEPLPRETLAALGVPPEGSLSALMLDMKSTFDDLVARFAESPAARERVLHNPIYRHVSDALAGSVEYSAMEKVYELSRSDAYDTLVVDTPPAQHALDFLDAPERLLEFLDSRLVKMLIHPAMVAGRLGARWFEWGTRRALGLIERISGIGFLQDVSEFLMAFEHMSEGFQARAKEVRSLLLGPESAFVLVASPESESVKSAQRFLARLEASNVSVAGIVANRVRAWPDDGPAPGALDPESPDTARLARALAEQGDANFPAVRAARAAIEAAARYAALVRRDATALDALREHAERRGSFFRAVPELLGDVHDLTGLQKVATALSQAPAARDEKQQAMPVSAKRGGGRG